MIRFSLRKTKFVFSLQKLVGMTVGLGAYVASSAIAVPLTSYFETQLISNVGTTWITVNLDNTYTNAIPVCTYVIRSFTANDPPAVTRIQNIMPTSFELRVQGWEDSAATASDVHCIIIDEGVHTLPDGLNVEAHSVLSDRTVGQFSTDGGWNGVALEDETAVILASPNTYVNPVVLGQVMSFNDARASVFHDSNCGARVHHPFQNGIADRICVGKHIGMIPSSRLPETVGYIVAETGSGIVNGVAYELALGRDRVLGNNGVTPSVYSVSRDYDIGVLTQAGEDGGHGSWAVLFGTDPLPANEITLVVDEEVFAGDITRAHTTEPVYYWVFEPSTLTLVKEVINDDGGVAIDTDFTLMASGPIDISGIEGDSEITEAWVPAGSYVLSETGPAGYSEDWVCDGGSLTGSDLTLTGTVVEDIVCTITNDDIPPTLTLEKNVVLDDGGTALDTDFTLTATGPETITGVEGNATITSASVEIGDYVLSEGGLDDYSFTTLVCTNATAGGTDVSGVSLAAPDLTLALNDDVSCTYTNDDDPATLTLLKDVILDDGGTALDTDFTLTATGPETITGAEGDATITSASVDVGDYSLSEDELDGYSFTTLVCSNTSAGGTDVSGVSLATPDLTLAPNDDVSCTYTNDDEPATLTLLKDVVLDDGGTALDTDFTLTATGPETITGVEGDASITSASVEIGDYVLSEGGLDDYSFTTLVCTNATAGGTDVSGVSLAAPDLTLALNDDVSCTYTNDDDPATLTLLKDVVLDDGGTALDTDFTLTATGPETITGAEGDATITSASVDVGDYSLSEDELDGYSFTTLVCSNTTAGGTDVSGVSLATPDLTLAPNDDVSCTYTNDDDPATLTLLKDVVLDDGGTALDTDFTLTATGPETITGVEGDATITSASVDVGVYSLSEDEIDGYSFTTLVCTNATAGGTDVSGVSLVAPDLMLAPNDDVSCTYTNDDDPAILTLLKDVVLDDGGTALDTDFTLTATGPETITGVEGDATITSASVDVGVYSLSEDEIDGYSFTTLVCSNATAGGTDVSGVSLAAPDLTLAPNDDVSCTYTNDDDPATLTLLKDVVLDDGGTALDTDFTLTATGPETITGVEGDATITSASVDVGVYSLSEDEIDGYSFTTLVCSNATAGGTDVSGVSLAAPDLTLAPNDDVSCTYTNDDDPAMLTLLKDVVLDDGGTALDTDFTLTATGPETITGVEGDATITSASVDVGVYSLSEDELDGYSFTTLVCSNTTAGGTDVSGVSLAAPDLTLDPNDDVSCTYTNDDDPATLTLLKDVVLDDGGTALDTDFTLTATGPETITGVEGDATITSASVDVGVYSLSEDELDGYSFTTLVCSNATAGGTDVSGVSLAAPDLTLAPNDDVSCTYTNDDDPATLTLLKDVVLDDGGTALDTDFTLTATGPETITGTEGDATITSASVDVGVYSLSEDELDGYSFTTLVCSNATAGGTDVSGVSLAAPDLTLAPNDDVSCTYTNDDDPAALTLLKDVVLDDGGTALDTDFTLTATGPETITGVEGDATITSASVDVGVYSLSEDEIDGYSFTTLVCSNTTAGGTDVSGVSLAAPDLTLAPNDDVSCTYTNDDDPATLTLLKNVVLDDGGTALDTDFTLTATGPETITGVEGDATITSASVDVGVYSLSEDELDGYSFTTLVCSNTTAGGTDVSGVSLAAPDLTLDPNDDVSCTYTNDDDPATLTLLKDVVLDDGGTALDTDFTLTATGPETITGVEGDATITSASVDVGVYSLSEDEIDGYSFTTLVCTNATAGGTDVSGVSLAAPDLTLAPNDNVSCTYTNDDDPAILTLLKDVVLDDGGTALDTDFTLTATGPETITGVEGDATITSASVDVGVYSLSEDELDGYSFTTLVCSNATAGGTDVSGVSLAAPDLTLAPNDDVSCTYTNDDDPATLTLLKDVVLDDGGTALDTDFTLTATGPETITGVEGDATITSASVDVGVYSLSEDEIDGYSFTTLVCSNATAGGTDVSGVSLAAPDLTLAPNDDVSCTYTNDDDPATLTLLKNVVLDDGGTALDTDFTLTATGPETITGVEGDATITSASVDVGVYSLSEDELDGYSFTTLVCSNTTAGGTDVSGVSLAAPDLTLAPNDGVSCTYTNDDDPAMLTLLKDVVLDDGGTALDTDFTLTATGPETITGVEGDATITSASVDVGVYSLSEDEIDGYSFTTLVCTNATAGGTDVSGVSLVAPDLMLAPNDDVSCTYTNDDDPAILTLLKDVVLDDGGTALDTDFTLTATGPETITGVEGDATITSASVDVGVYSLSEDEIDGYSFTTLVCSNATAGGTDVSGVSLAAPDLTLAPNDDVSCTYTNDDDPATLTLLKDVVLDDGGTALDTDFTLTATGPETITGVEGDATITSASVDVGVYSLSEDEIDGYSFTTLVCSNATAGGTDVSGVSLAAPDLTLAPNDDVSCTYTNDDDPATLTLLKNVVLDDGGTALDTDFTLTATGPETITGVEGDATITSASVDVGVYSLSEDELDGYSFTTLVCSNTTAGGTDVSGVSLAAPDLTLAPNDDVSCTYTNDDDPATLTLLKDVVLDDGGTALDTDFTLTATGPETITGVEGDATITSASVDVGVYSLSEDEIDGYSFTTLVCSNATAGGTDVSGVSLAAPDLTLAPNDDVSCTYTNDDDPATLTLLKNVVLDDGGTALDTDFTLTATGPETITGVEGDATITSASVDVGVYSLSEDELDGYSFTTLVCSNTTAGGTDVSGVSLATPDLTLAPNDNVSCTYTNDDDPAILTLLKDVVLDDGGTALDTDFTLTATGPETITGTEGEATITSSIVDVGVYSLSEGELDGYSFTTLVCSNATAGGTDVSGVSLAAPDLTLAPNDDVSCTYTNDDDPATLTLLKDVVLDDGGTALDTDFTLTATGPETITGVEGDATITSASVDVGVYSLSEDEIDGYSFTTLVCTNATAGGTDVSGVSLATPDLTLAPNDDVSCTYTNDDDPATLTLLKDVVLDDGGTALDTDFTLTATGPETITGVEGDATITSASVDVGVYSLSEDEIDGYSFTTLVCTNATAGGTDVSGVSLVAPDLMLAPNDDVSCTYTNDDDPAILTLLKDVVLDDGGTALDTDFTLTATGPETITGVEGDATITSASVDVGVYSLSEDEIDGYSFTTLVCSNATAGGTDVSGVSLAAPDLTLAPNDDVSCTYTNDDDPATLTLLKDVVLDDGGTALDTDFTLTATGPETITGVEGDATITSASVDVGVYSLSEDEIDGYSFTTLVCSNATAGGTDVSGVSLAAPDLTLAPNDDVSCTYTNDDDPATLTLLKNVVLDDGGTALDTDFTLTATGPETITGVEGDATITSASVDVGVYSLSEDELDGYSFTTLVCSNTTAGGTDVSGVSLAAPDLTLDPNDDVSCTYTNDDDPATLTLLKDVVLDDGGTALDTDFTLTATGPETITGVEGDATITSASVDVGVYSLSEDELDGYSFTTLVCSNTTVGGTDVSGVSLAAPDLTLDPNDDVSCTYTNDDDPATLTLLKDVVLDDGGTALDTDFTLTATGPETITGVEGDATITSASVDVGVYSLSEDELDGYSFTTLVCSNTTAGGTDVSGVSLAAPDLTLAPNDGVSCTYTNDDDPAMLTLLKDVVLDDGGTALDTDFTLTATGPETITGVEGDATITSASVDVGVYSLSEDEIDGYSFTTLVCTNATAGGTDVSGVSLVAPDLMLAPNDDVSCTYTNDDDPAILTLLKDVVLDDGGTALDTDFTLTATGPETITGVEGDATITSASVDVGVYSLSEDEIDGYSFTTLVCSNATAGGTDVSGVSLAAPDLTLAPNDDVSCTYTNDDDPATLTLLKDVVLDDGGTALDTDFTLTATGPETITGVEGDATITSASVDVGVYSLSEDEIDGYSFTTLVCSNATAGGTDVSGVSLAAPDLTLAPNDDVSCTYTNDDDPATLTLLKDVVLDDGGTALDTDFTLMATGPETITGVEGDATITSASVDVGVYSLSEDEIDGYSFTTLVCSNATAGGTDVSGVSLAAPDLTLAPNDDVSCTYTNDDDPATLTLLKNVVLDDGGTALDTDFTLTATGPETITGVEGDATITSASVDVGVYSLSEDELDGYSFTTLVCSNTTAGGTDVSGVSLAAPDLTLDPNDDVSCTYTNDDDPATLTLLKDVVLDDGGTALDTDFTLTATGPETITGVEGDATITSASVDVGVYSLSEDELDGYSFTTLVCSNTTVGGTDVSGVSLAAPDLTLDPNDDVSCTYTNDDDPATLTLLKDVVLDDGGTALDTDFTLTATGPETITGVEGDATITSASVDVGVYSLSEDELDGYSFTTLVCSNTTAGGTDVSGVSLAAPDLTLDPNDDVSCTYTNDDDPATLTLLKDVVLDDGGTALDTDFTLTATGPETITGVEGDATITSASVDVGVYSLSEDEIDGYSFTTLVCTNATAGGTDVSGVSLAAPDLTLAPNDNVSCTYTNDDDPAILTLLKDVVLDDGGTALDTDFTLTATGPETITGVEGDATITSASVDVGVYSLSEDELDGYSFTTLVCSNATAGGTDVSGVSLAAPDLTLAPNDDVSCTYTNDDDPAILTLLKDVVLDDGGTALDTDFTLTATGPETITGVEGDATITSASVDVGVYSLSEDEIDGYSFTTLVCSNATAGGTDVSGVSLAAPDLTLDPNDDVSCTYTNDDDPATLTLLKDVVLDDGGTALDTDFTLTATGPETITGTEGEATITSSIVDVGVYSLSEGELDGYSFTTLVCSNATAGGTDVSGVSLAAPDLTLAPNDDVSCTYTNDDDPATLTLLKDVVLDDGGTALDTDFTLTATGPETITGVEGDATITSASVDVGVYSLSEDEIDGYSFTTLVCSNATAGGTDVSGVSLAAPDLTLAPNDDVSCTYTNDDDPATLTLLKDVVLDDGGTALDTDFTLTATGPETITGVEGDATITSASVDVGVYSLSEDELDGYSFTTLVCTNATAGGTDVSGVSLAAPDLTLAPNDDVSCTYTNDDDPATLTLLKDVVLDDGGTALDTDFTLTATGPETITGVEGDATITSASVDVGVYSLSEDEIDGYSFTTLVCTNATAGGTDVSGVSLAALDLMLAPNDNVSCTYTNDDDPAILTLLKDVVLDDGGTALDTDFTLTATGPETITGTEGEVTITSSIVDVGVYSLSEGELDGYSFTTLVCSNATAGGTDVSGVSVDTLDLTLAPNDDVSCTYTNDDDPAALTLLKDVVLDDGGTALDTDFTLTATGPETITGVEGDATITSASVDVGVYSLSEDEIDGYSFTTLVCTNATAGGTDVSGVSLAAPDLMLAPNDDVSCTYTNDDDPAILTLLKDVVLDDGGTALDTDFTLTATGPETITGTEGEATITSSIVDVGVYSLSEGELDGYSFTTLVCSNATAGGTDVSGVSLAAPDLTLAPNDDVSCTYTNDDDPAILTLLKDVVLDDGGTALDTDFTLTATGPETITGVEGDATITSASVDVGVYSLSENELDGYSFTTLVCSNTTAGGTDVSGVSVDTLDLTLAPNDDVSCTYTNDDDPATLTLLKDVVLDDGGTALDTDFTLTATGPETITGTEGDATITSASVDVGVYSLSEDELDRYSFTSLVCSNATAGGTDVSGVGLATPDLTLAPNDDVSCTYTNDDDPATLTLLKDVVLDDGGTALDTDFTLTATGPETITGTEGDATITSASVDVGVYSLSEDEIDGYSFTTLVCSNTTVGGTDVSGVSLAAPDLTLAPNDDVSCTYTNDDDPATLTLLKDLLNGISGTAADSDFTLSASGPETVTGVEGDAAITAANVDVGVYTLSEDELGGYTFTSLVCTNTTIGGTDVSGVNIGARDITLAPNDDVSCSFTNTQIPDLLVTKSVAPAAVIAGGLLTFTIEVSNIGILPATLVELTDILPASLILDSGTPPLASQGAFDAVTGIWTVGTVSNTDQHTLTLAVELQPEEGVCAVDYENIVSVTAQGETDFDETNHEANAVAQLISIAAAKTLGAGTPIDQGDGTYQISYVLLIRNNGGVMLNDIQVVDDLQAIIDTPIDNDATIDPASVTVTTPDPTFTLNPAYDGASDTNLLLGTDTLAPGAEGTIEITFTLTPHVFFGRFENQATVSAVTEDGTPVSDLSEDGASISTVFNFGTPQSSHDNCIVDSPTVFQLDIPTTPITLGWLKSSDVGGGQVLFEWSTEAEVGNVGYYLWSQDASGEWTKLNEAMIESQGDSLTVQDYSYHAYGVTGNSLRITDVDLHGKQVHHGPYQLGEEVGVRSERKAIDWDSINRESEELRRQREQQQLDELNRRLQGSTETQSLRSRLGGLLAMLGSALISPVQATELVNIDVDRAGIYRVTHAQLMDANLDLSGTPGSSIGLKTGNELTPMKLHTTGSSWGAGAYIEFAGRSVETLYTGTNKYTLVLNEGQRLIGTDDRAIPDGPAAYSYLDEVVYAEQNEYTHFSPDKDDAWYADRLSAITGTAQKTVNLTLDEHAPSFAVPFSVGGYGPSAAQMAAVKPKLDVRLWGASALPGNGVTDPDHHVTIELNGQQVADERFDGLRVRDVAKPLASVIDGDNQIKVTLPKDHGYAFDLVNLDQIRLSYPRRFKAKENGQSLVFASSWDKFRVFGLNPGDATVYRMDLLGEVDEMTVKEASCPGGALDCLVSFAGSEVSAQDDLYFVSTESGITNNPPQITLAPAAEDLFSGNAAYLIISHPDFIGANLDAYAADLASIYGSADIVSVESIFAQYSGQVLDANAIHAYVKDAYTTRGTQHVLLVGGDMYDYYDNLGSGAKSFVPSLYVQTGLNLNRVPSDAKYGDVDDDNIPEMGVARLPVRSNGELNTLLSKRDDYLDRGNGANNYAQKAVFSADKVDGVGYSFKADSEQVIAASFTSGWQLDRAYLDDLGADAKQTLIDAINEGSALTSYTGHSSTDKWSLDDLLSGSDVAGLSNVGKPTVVAQWGCWNTFFVSPEEESLSHRFLLEGDRGAVVVMGASSLTSADAEKAMSLLLYDRLDQGMRISDAVLSAKQAFAEDHPEALDVLLGWAVLGAADLSVN